MKQTKICTECKKELPLTTEYFGIDNSNKSDGFRNRCKACINQRAMVLKDTRYLRKRKKSCKEGHKICSKCSREFPLTDEYFGKSKNNTDGFDGRCRECMRKYYKEQREKKHPPKEKINIERNIIEYNGYTFAEKENARGEKTSYFRSTAKIYNGKRIELHRYVWIINYGEIPKGYVVHHIDNDKRNNDISNLALMSFSEHSKYHSKKRIEENPESVMENFSKRLTPEAIAKKNAWLQSEEGKASIRKMIERSRELGINEKTEIVICQYCEKEFKTTKCRISSAKFCSQKCSIKARVKSGVYDIEKECANCGKKFIIFKHMKRETCSEQCRYELRSKKYHPNVIHENNCVICGKKFEVGNYKDKQTCSIKCRYILSIQTREGVKK
jgi:predicted nucleic acid-binding Zn ribbon protein